MVLDTGWGKHFCGTLILQTRIFLHFAGSRLYVGKETLFRLGDKDKYLQFFASRAQLKWPHVRNIMYYCLL